MTKQEERDVLIKDITLLAAKAERLEANDKKIRGQLSHVLGSFPLNNDRLYGYKAESTEEFPLSWEKIFFKIGERSGSLDMAGVRESINHIRERVEFLENKAEMFVDKDVS